MSLCSLAAKPQTTVVARHCYKRWAGKLLKSHEEFHFWYVDANDGGP